MNALSLISKRAKQMRNANKKLSQVDAIKKASAEYRAGKLGKVGKVKKYKQRGSSDRTRDVQRKAKKPGKRKSRATGRTYTEVRKNRSDAPGKLTGTAVPSQISNELRSVQQADAMIWKIRNTPKRGLTSLQKNELKRQLVYYRKARVMHRRNISNLKRLI